MVQITLAANHMTGSATLLDMPYDQDSTTFENLLSFLKSKLGNQCFRIHVPDHGILALSTDDKSKLLATKFLPSWTIPVSVIPLGAEIKLIIELEDSSMVTLSIRDSDSISDLRIAIEETAEIPRDEQEFSIDLDAVKTTKENSVDESTLTLKEVGLHNGSLLKISRRVKGGARSTGSGAVHMIDLFGPSHENRFRYSGSGHIYQSIGNGLVLEGVCPTSQCEAYMARVYDTKRYGVFDMRDKNIAQCPICKAAFSRSIQSVAFNNCFYSIRGIARDSREEQIVAWTRVGDVERMWDRTISGVKTFLFLQVVTAPLCRGITVPGTGTRLAPVARECAICNQNIGRDNGLGGIDPNGVVMRPCEHSFHANCWKNWSVVSGNNRRGQKACPMCAKNSK